MKLSKLIFTLVSVFCFQGCLSHLVFTERVKGYRINGEISYLKLNSSYYDLFVRKGYSYGNLLLSAKSLDSISNNTAGVVRSGSIVSQRVIALENLKHTTDSMYKIIEIEYLFVSKSNGLVIYISTVADRYQMRYNGEDFLGINRPNAADFRVFFFGKAAFATNEKKIIFDYRNKKHTDIWSFNTEPDKSIVLHSIEKKRGITFDEAYLAETAFAVPLVFELIQGDWDIVFRNDKMTEPVSLSGEGIILVKNQDKYTLQFNFQDRQVNFANKLIIYAPDSAIENLK